jgi:hypothetical protein
MQVVETREKADNAEQIAEEMCNRIAGLEAVAGKIRELQKKVEGQALAIAATETAMAKTDALVELVVDTLETLQTSVMDAMTRIPPVASPAVLAHHQQQARFRQAG